MMVRANGGFGDTKPALLVRHGGGEALLWNERHLQYFASKKSANTIKGKVIDDVPRFVVQANFSPRGINKEAGQALHQLKCITAMVGFRPASLISPDGHRVPQVSGDNYSDQGTLLLTQDHKAFMKSVSLWKAACWLNEDPLHKTLSTGNLINTRPADGGVISSKVSLLVAGLFS